MKARLALICTLGLFAAGTTAAGAEEPTPVMPAETVAVDDSAVFTEDYTLLENRFRPSMRFRHITGDGVGWVDNFTTAELMLPFKLTDWNDTAFVDFRGIYSNTDHGWANLGAGWRWLDVDRQRIYGANVWYDFRDTDAARYSQAGIGFESLGDRWDFRANIYFPAGKDESLLASTVVPFAGGFDTVQLWEKAMEGFDAEAGLTLSRRFAFRVFAGVYHFETDYSEQVWGGRLRASIQPVRGFEFGVQYTKDRVFEDNVNAFFTLYLPPSNLRVADKSYNFANRMADRVERNYNIVLQDQTRVIRTFD